MSEIICEVDVHSGFSPTGEEIVRCRDCKHYTDDEMEYYHYCGSWCEQVEPDGFCYRGERRDA